MTLMSVLLYPIITVTKCVPTLRDRSPVDVTQDMRWTVIEHRVLVNFNCDVLYGVIFVYLLKF